VVDVVVVNTSFVTHTCITLSHSDPGGQTNGVVVVVVVDTMMAWQSPSGPLLSPSLHPAVLVVVVVVEVVVEMYSHFESPWLRFQHLLPPVVASCSPVEVDDCA
jgi:hypothetical protein